MNKVSNLEEEEEKEEDEEEEGRRRRRKKWRSIEFNSVLVTLKFILTKIMVQTIPELYASQAC